MGDPYKDNMYKSTAETVKSEIKTGLFFYVIITIISGVIAYVFGAIIIALVVICGIVWRLLMTPEQRERHDEQVHQEALEERGEMSKANEERVISELKEITRIHNG